MKQTNSITFFTAERAGILVSFGANLSFDRKPYTAYLKHCEKRKLVPIGEDAFIDVHIRIINGLREWWYQTQTGIYIEDDIE